MADDNGNLAATLSGLRAYENDLTRRIESLERDRDAIRRTLALMEREGIGRSEPVDFHIMGLSSMSPQLAVETVLEAFPDREFRPPEIRDELLSHKYKYERKTPLVTVVSTCLARAVKKGFALRTPKGGHSVYRLNRPGASADMFGKQEGGEPC